MKSIPWTAKREFSRDLGIGRERKRTVGKTVLSLYVINTELDLSERVLVVLVEVREREFENSTLESISSVFYIAASAPIPPHVDAPTHSFQPIG